MSDKTEQLLEQVIVQLNRVAREMTTTRELTSKFVHAMIEKAESEIPEYARRFGNWMHDLHDIRYMYEELGHAPPPWLLREVERCDDRFRQLLERLHNDTGEFEKIRREMASDPDNRWDHTRLLYPPKKEKGNEAG